MKRDASPVPVQTDPPDTSLRAFLHYLRSERNASAHTVNSYRIDILQFAEMILGCKPDAGNIPWSRATVRDARGFVIGLQERGVSKISVTRKLSALRSFYRYMERESLSDVNPFSGLTSPKREKRLPKFMTTAEVGSLLDAPTAYWRERLADGVAKTDESAELGAVRDSAILEVIYSGGTELC